MYKRQPYETAETYLYGTAVKLKEAPEKEGYTFSGWDHEEDFTMPAENVVINGSFSINSYKVTYEVDGSAYGKEETYEYGSAVTLQKEPKKEDVYKRQGYRHWVKLYLFEENVMKIDEQKL